MRTIKIDFDTITGKIKPMHAINNPPTVPNDTYGLYAKIQEANIPYARLHDTGGRYGGARYVDVGNIFPDFSADENDPASYDFAFTDALLAAMDTIGLRPFYRLGCTIENDHKIKAYRIYPPADPRKWARICAHIIMHYNEGWAQGFRYGIEYWEIWNEPDNQPAPEDNPMWRGTQEQFFELYGITARYLKDRFPGLKIGGYASCGFSGLERTEDPRQQYWLEFFHNFMKYISAKCLPLDFFSWHSYAEVKGITGCAAYAREQLDRYGFPRAQSIFNEWNPRGNLHRGTALDAANVAAVLCAMQKSPTDMCMYYDGQLHSSYCGLFSADNKCVFKAYYAFKAFGALYALGNAAHSETDDSDLYVCAAVSEEHRAALVVNASNERKEVMFDVPGCVAACFATDGEHDYERIDIDITGAVVLPAYAVWFITL